MYDTRLMENWKNVELKETFSLRKKEKSKKYTRTVNWARKKIEGIFSLIEKNEKKKRDASHGHSRG